MPITAVSISTFGQSANQPAFLTLSRQLTDLRKALTADNLGAARTAFVQVQKTLLSMGPISDTALSSDAFTKLSKALRSDNLADARSALADWRPRG